MTDSDYDQREYVRLLEIDIDEAVEYAKQFAGQGSIRAMIALADYCYDHGDREKSIEWMTKAESSVSSDDFVSPIYLASAYRRGLGKGTNVSRRKKALSLLTDVAESGNLPVIHELMYTYLEGLNGAERDVRRFQYWAEKAIQFGSADAAELLKSVLSKKAH